MGRKTNIYKEVINTSNKKLAVVLDPDMSEEKTVEAVNECNRNNVDIILLGGSLVTNGNADTTARIIKQHSSIPVILFPGSEIQLTKKADALLFLSLISGRNPELLIGKHVSAGAFIKRSGIETIPSGYILIDGGRPTSVTYMSNTNPIPADKPDIAMATAIAGELLGMKLIFMDAGSGALKPISAKMIKKVKSAIDIPIIIGGGMKTPQDIEKAFVAGADIVVIGSSVEDNPGIIKEMAAMRDKFSSPVEV